MEQACLYTANEDLQVKYLVYSLGENLCYQYFSQWTNIHNLQIIEKVNCLSPPKRTSHKCADEQTNLRLNTIKIFESVQNILSHQWHGYYNYLLVSFHSSSKGCHQKQTNKHKSPNKPKNLTNSGKNVERKNRLPAVRGNVNWYSFCGNESGDFSHRTKTRTVLSDSTISPQWAWAQTVSDPKDSPMGTFTVVPVVRAGRWEEPRCTSTGE